MIKTTAKTLLQSLLLVILSVFIACSEDEGITAGVSGKLIGSWNSGSVAVTDITINGDDLATYYTNLGISPDLIEQIETALESEIEQGFQIDIEFKSDGTYTSTDSEGTDSGTWELTSNDTKVLFDKGTEDELEVNIVSLTESMFVGSFTQVDDSEDIDEDGINDELSISISITLNK
ncbi:hypothetical protein SAMN05421640_3083 [Ekhidna lutea]|uniref:Lipocalin-like domain-containing protein n=1 Tax=Ekhidna lutea TaxID=447679 RepID=A0A239L982_EKHLU|nr:hypothetical protein [Ekhidna lutea]SNT27166.1 hypothetical protein SAMN05421640_3083 [Ekhidna lutea]